MLGGGPPFGSNPGCCLWMCFLAIWSEAKWHLCSLAMSAGERRLEEEEKEG